MKTLLERALNALKKGRSGNALNLLLAAWRTKRAPELADVIDSVSEACAARLEPLPPRIAVDDFEAWREICWKRNPEDFERLVAVQLPKTGRGVERMVESFWQDDPRVGRFYARLILDRTISSKGRDATRRNTHADIYGRIAGRLVQLRDSRSADALASMSFVPADFPWLKAQQAEAFGLVGVKLTSNERHLVEQLSARLPARRVPPASRPETKELLAQVYARPDDLSARAVYADALVESGDPRGEFISLQLNPSRDLRREAALLRKHEARWGGPVARWFHTVGRVFEGGFFAGGKLTDEYENDRVNGAVPIKRGLVEPSWRLVTTIEFPLGTEEQILSHPNLAWVRHVEFDHEALARLSGRTWPFTSVMVSYWFSEEGEAVPLLRHADDFPHLQKLGFGSVFGDSAPALFDWLPKAPVLNRLKQLTLDLWQTPVAPWLPALEQSRLPELQVESRLGWRFLFTRDAGGAFSRLKCLWPRSRKKNLELELFELLDELPSNALTEFQLEESTLAKPALRGRLKKALSKFKKLPRTLSTGR